MPQSRRERLVTFVISVVLCCMMSGSLSLMAKKSRDKSAVSQRTARVATPHDDMSRPLADGSQIVPERLALSQVMSNMNTSLNGSIATTKPLSDNEELAGAVRVAQPIGGSFVTGAILCLGAALCCAITAIGALLLLRGARGGSVHQSEEGDSDEFMGKKGEQERTEKGSGFMDTHKLLRDEVDEVTPEEAV